MLGRALVRALVWKRTAWVWVEMEGHLEERQKKYAVWTKGMVKIWVQSTFR